jgi:hypothetical protein
VHRAAIFVSGSRNEQDEAYFEVEVPGQIKWAFTCPAPSIDDPIVHALEDARDTLNSETHFDLRKSLNEAGI